MRHFPCALALAVLPVGVQAAGPVDVERFGWLAGCWKLETGDAGSGEQWMPPAGGQMLGMSRTLRNGQVASFEFMQLRRQADGTLAFIAQPSGRPPTVFPLLRAGESDAVFENAQHDFPQRVLYARQGDRLQARIEGLRSGVLRGIDFPMVRVPC